MWNVCVSANCAETWRDEDMIVVLHNESFSLEEEAIAFAKTYIQNKFWNKDAQLVSTETGGYYTRDTGSWAPVMEITAKV